jgi:hypothetical protein
MRRASWTAVAAGLVAALGLPAAASAKTVVVDANGPDQYMGSCTSLTYYSARLADRSWTFPLKRRNRLPRGRYEIRVRATDIAGNASDAPRAAAGTLVTFRIV